MNPRIKQLAEHANLQDGWFCGQGNIEKFAQLIVRECVNIVQKNDGYRPYRPGKVIRNGGQRKGAFGNEDLRPHEIATMINEHFGVEL